MKKIFTIGVSKKTAEKFFKLLEDNNICCVIDVRLYNSYQLAGFSKYPDIEYFLSKLLNIKYIHDNMMAPSENLLKAYRDKKINWEEYEEIFNQVMNQRGIVDYIEIKYPDLDKHCLMCNEDKPDKCHRRLLAELISDNFDDFEIIHLI